MDKLDISQKKFENLQKCSNEQGIIAAAAMDQRGSLRRSIEKDGGQAETSNMQEFKIAVTEVLTNHATAILLDPNYGLPASQKRAQGAGLLLAYEASGYDNSTPGRMPKLLDGWSVGRLAEKGATGLLLLLYSNPDDDNVNSAKHAFIERIGAECETVGLPFFLEPVTYNDALDGELELAKKKPDYVTRTMQEFSKDIYRVDILKVEFPFLAKYVGGLGAAQETAYTRQDCQTFFQDATAAATKPFIYLSAGVDMDVFIASLELAGEANVPFSGVLCGRATWKEGIPVYAKEGEAALRTWLEAEGVDNIKRLNAVLEQHAKPWWHRYGGRDALNII